jgi:hypothetical protein
VQIINANNLDKESLVKLKLNLQLFSAKTALKSYLYTLPQRATKIKEKLSRFSVFVGVVLQKKHF